MADRTLTMKLVVDDKDVAKAKQSMKALGDETKKAGDAAEKLNRAAQGGGKGPAQYTGGGPMSVDDAAYAALNRQNWQKAVKARLDQLRPDRGMGGSTGDTGKIEGPKSIEDLAYEKVNAKRNAAAIQKAAQGIAPDLFKGGKGEGGESDFKVPRSIKRLIGARMLGGAIRGITDHLEASVTNPNLTVGQTALAGAKDLPFGIGHAVKLGEMAFGDKVSRMATADQAQRVRGMYDRSEQERALQIGGRGELHDLAIRQQVARSDAVAERAAAGVTANAAPGQYITENILGKSNEQTGPLQQALDEAKARAGAGGVGDREKALAAAQAEVAQAKREREEAGVRAATASISVGETKRAYDKAYEGGGLFSDNQIGFRESAKGKAIKETREKYLNAQQNAVGAQGQVELAAQKEQEKITAAKKEQVALEAERGKQAERNLAVAKAEADVAKNRADIAKHEVDVIKGAQAQFGQLDEAGQQSLVDVAKRFKEGGIKSLAPDELQQLKGTGLFDKQIEDDSLKQGDNSRFKEVRDLAGVKDLDSATANWKQSADDAAKLLAESNAKFKEEMAASIDKSVTELGTIITAAIENSVATLRNKFEKDATDKAIHAANQN